MIRNYDEYSRVTNIIKNAVYNDDVNLQFNKHYNKLYLKLVLLDSDKDVFNNTFLKMTVKYNPNEDFIKLFTALFRHLKTAFRRDKKYFINADFILTSESSKEGD